MDDKHTPAEVSADTDSVAKLKSQRKQRHPVSMMIAGTLIAVLAVGVGVQMLRANSQPRTSNSDKQAASPANGDFGLPASRVNGEVITREQLARECMDQFGLQVLEALINRRIIQQACAERGIQVTDAEVNEEVTRISKNAGLPKDQWYKFIQSERGLTALQYHRDVVWPLLALKRIAGRDVEVTREMLKEAYIDNYGPRVKARMIVFDNFGRARKLAEELHQNPEQFEDYAREHSVEPNSKVLGGKVPPIRRFSGAHEEIRKAAFRLKTEGEVSPLLQIGPQQYAILQYEGRTEPVEHDPKDVQTILHEELKERQVQMLVAETFEELKKQARVDNYVTGETTSPIRQTAASSDDDITFDVDEPTLE